MAEPGITVLGGGGMTDPDSAVLGGGGIEEQEERAVRGGGGITDPDNAVVGGSGISDPDSAVLGGGGISDPDRAVLGGGGITGPSRPKSKWDVLQVQLADEPSNSKSSGESWSINGPPADQPALAPISILPIVRLARRFRNCPRGENFLSRPGGPQHDPCPVPAETPATMPFRRSCSEKPASVVRSCSSSGAATKVPPCRPTVLVTSPRLASSASACAAANCLDPFQAGDIRWPLRSRPLVTGAGCPQNSPSPAAPASSSSAGE